MTGTFRAASSNAAFTLLSRLLGFVRDVIMLRLLGSGWVMDTFVFAWMLPNLLRRLLGEGALSASFVPAYAATLDRDGRAQANQLLRSVSGALLVGLTGLTAAVMIVLAIIPPSWLSGDSSALQSGHSAQSGWLLVRLTLILFPYVVLICLVAIYCGALNAHGVFAWPAALPVILNVFWIAGLAVGAATAASDVELAVISAGFLLAAGFAQLGVAAWQLHRRRALPAPGLPRGDDAAREVFVRMVPTVLGLSMFQLNTLLDHAFAYYLLESGANTHVYNANRLLLFPHALTSLALATVLFPRFAVLASRTQMAELGAAVDRALDATLFLSLPAAVGLILVAPDFLHVFFEGGKFDAPAVAGSAATTSCLAAGLPFLGASQLYARALYAMGDTRSPARIAVVLVPVNVALNALFALALGAGASGLTLATSVCAALNALALRQILRARCRSASSPGGALWRAIGSTALMAIAVIFSRRLFDADSTLEVAVLHLGLPIALGIAVYIAAQAMLGGEEARRLLRRSRA